LNKKILVSIISETLTSTMLLHTIINIHKVFVVL